MATCDVGSLISTAGRFMCLPLTQLLGVQTELLRQLVLARNPMAATDVQSLLTAGKCFEHLPVAQVLGIQTQLLCEILQAGGVSANSCLVCGDTDPVADPACDCALGYNRLTGAFFMWDDSQTAWLPLISP